MTHRFNFFFFKKSISVSISRERSFHAIYDWILNRNKYWIITFFFCLPQIKVHILHKIVSTTHLICVSRCLNQEFYVLLCTIVLMINNDTFPPLVLKKNVCNYKFVLIKSDSNIQRFRGLNSKHKYPMSFDQYIPIISIRWITPSGWTSSSSNCCYMHILVNFGKYFADYQYSFALVEQLINCYNFFNSSMNCCFWSTYRWSLFLPQYLQIFSCTY